MLRTMQSSILFLMLLAFGLSACSVKREWIPTSGNRAGGTVKLSYEIGSIEVAETDDAQGLRSALERCRAWGYTDAEEFGAQTRSCNYFDSSGCKIWQISKEYQCLGNPD